MTSKVSGPAWPDLTVGQSVESTVWLSGKQCWRPAVIVEAEPDSHIVKVRFTGDLSGITTIRNRKYQVRSARGQS